jgi:hypothetical protein
MSESKRKFEMEVPALSSMSLGTRASEQDDLLKSGLSRLKRRPRTYSRQVVLRLIDWFKKDEGK